MREWAVRMALDHTWATIRPLDGDHILCREDRLLAKLERMEQQIAGYKRDAAIVSDIESRRRTSVINRLTMRRQLNAWTTSNGNYPDVRI
jgi:hypothetical protein